MQTIYIYVAMYISISVYIFRNVSAKYTSYDSTEVHTFIKSRKNMH
jgi:hypothetical protein